MLGLVLLVEVYTIPLRRTFHTRHWVVSSQPRVTPPSSTGSGTLVRTFTVTTLFPVSSQRATTRPSPSLRTTLWDWLGRSAPV